MLVILVLLLAALLWFVAGGREDSHEPTVYRQVNERDIDRSELERAERDVRDATDEDSVRDWGPGASQPRPPHLL